MNNLNVYRNWGLGYVEEVLNGANYKPSGVCPHQCWSETMVLQPAIEGMLGIDVNASEPEIQISPQLPVNWDSIKIEHIRVGDRRIDMSFSRKGKNCVYQFHGTGGKVTINLAPYFPAGTVFGKASIDGREIPLTVVTKPLSARGRCHFCPGGQCHSRHPG